MAWTDHVTLRLEVASLGASGAGKTSKWSAPSDEFKWRWTPATSDASGEAGRWESVINVRDQNWSDWKLVPWIDVVCDAMTVSCAQGWSPFQSNASPNSASFVLVDPAMDFAPPGPDGRLRTLPHERLRIRLGTRARDRP